MTKRKKSFTSYAPATAEIGLSLSNLEYGKKIRAEGIKRRQERDRQKAIKAAKELLGRKIRL